MNEEKVIEKLGIAKSSTIQTFLDKQYIGVINYLNRLEKFDEIKSLIEGLAEKIENKEAKPGKYEALLTEDDKSDLSVEKEQQAPFKPEPKPHVFKNTD